MLGGDPLPDSLNVQLDKNDAQTRFGRAAGASNLFNARPPATTRRVIAEKGAGIEEVCERQIFCHSVNR